MTSPSSVGLALAVQMAICAGLYLWGLWVSRRHAKGLFRLAPSGVLLGTVLSLGGAFVALRRLSGSGDTALNAEQYADRVSSDFAIAALPIALGGLILLVSVMVLIGGTLTPPSRRENT